MRRRTVKLGLTLCLAILSAQSAIPSQAGEHLLAIIPADVECFVHLDVAATANAGVSPFLAGIEQIDTAWRWLHANTRQALGASPDAIASLTAFCYSESSLGLVVIVAGDLQPEATHRFLRHEHGYECADLDARIVHSWQPNPATSQGRLYAAFCTDSCLVAGTSLEGLRKSLAVLDEESPSLAGETTAPSPDCLFVASFLEQPAESEAARNAGRRAVMSVEIRLLGENIVISASSVCATDSEAQEIRLKWNQVRDAVLDKATLDSPGRRIFEDCHLVIIGRALEFRAALKKRDLNASAVLARALEAGVRAGLTVDLHMDWALQSTNGGELPSNPGPEADAAAAPAAPRASRLPPDPFEELTEAPSATEQRK